MVDRNLSRRRGGSLRRDSHRLRPEVGSGHMRTTEHAETAVAGTEDGWRRALQRLPQPPFRVAEGVSAPSVVEMFRLESESTNETYSYAMPTNGARETLTGKSERL